MQACSAYNYICTPLYDTLGDETVEYVVNHAEISIVFVHPRSAKSLAAALPKCHCLKHVVLMTDGYEEKESLAGHGVKVWEWSEFLASSSSIAPEVRPSTDDLNTIMYTSGTTGAPKGVMIKHGAMVSVVRTEQRLALPADVVAT
eukprot:scaffold7382_cov406-Prasinococcus_capsulatus_cf.AAC.16